MVLEPRLSVGFESILILRNDLDASALLVSVNYIQKVIKIA